MSKVETTQQGRIKEVGVKQMDRQAAKMLNISTKKPTRDQEDLLGYIMVMFETGDVTPMNSKYGPISGMTEWERLIRAYEFGLLTEKTFNR